MHIHTQLTLSIFWQWVWLTIFPILLPAILMKEHQNIQPWNIDIDSTVTANPPFISIPQQTLCPFLLIFYCFFFVFSKGQSIAYAIVKNYLSCLVCLCQLCHNSTNPRQLPVLFSPLDLTLLHFFSILLLLWWSRVQLFLFFGYSLSYPCENIIYFFCFVFSVSTAALRRFIDGYQDRSCFDHYVEGVIYQALTDNKRRKEE